jgi:hypothetical protein
VPSGLRTSTSQLEPASLSRSTAVAVPATKLQRRGLGPLGVRPARRLLAAGRAGDSHGSAGQADGDGRCDEGFAHAATQPGPDETAVRALAHHAALA